MTRCVKRVALLEVALYNPDGKLAAEATSAGILADLSACEDRALASARRLPLSLGSRVRGRVATSTVRIVYTATPNREASTIPA